MAPTERCAPFACERSFWWDLLLLAQRIALGGLLLLLNVRRRYMRLLVGMAISVGYLVAIIVCAPYRRKLDHLLAAGCQVLLMCTFVGGIVVCFYEEAAEETTGSAALAYQLLGLHSSDAAIACMIASTMAVLALFGCAICGEICAYDSGVRSTWKVCTMDPPHVKDWRLRDGFKFAAFISHCKVESGTDARYMHDVMRQMLRAPVFLGMQLALPRPKEAHC